MFKYHNKKLNAYLDLIKHAPIIITISTKSLNMEITHTKSKFKIKYVYWYI